jgi:1-acyl-sn-glycerol-3-phosphate acyltransferase
MIVAVWTRIRSVFGVIFVVPFTALFSSLTILSSFMGPQRIPTEVMRFWARWVLFVFGIRVVASGEENLPETGGGIITFNHQSHFDIPVLMRSTRKHVRFGAKIELFKIPVFGPAMRSVGTLPIARDNRAEVMRIYKDAEARFKDNTLFLLAPEGTRQSEPKIGRFKKGPFTFAINAGVPIIPVVIKGAYTVLPKGSLTVNVGKMSRTIYIQYLPPISTKGLGLDAVESVLAQAHSAMLAAYDKLP